jgi:hypothetical protein
VGLAGVVPVTLVLGLAGWPVTAWAFLLLLILFSGAAWLLGAGSHARREPRLASGPPWLVWGARAVLVLAVAVMLWKLWLVPVWSWDHLAIWGVKARRLAAAGGFDLSFLSQPDLLRSNPHYPLGLPASQLLLTLGAVPGDGAFRLIHVAFALALLAALRGAAGRLSGMAPVGDAAAAFVALSPLAWDTENVGLADLPLAFFAVAAVAVLVRALPTGLPGATGCEPTSEPTSEPDLRRLAVAGLLAGFLPWLKDEGLVLALLLLGVAAAWTWGGGMGVERTAAAWRRWLRSLGAFAVPALALAAAARLYTLLALPAGKGFLSGDWAGRLAARLPQVPSLLVAMARELIDPGFFGLWLVFAVAVVLVAALYLVDGSAARRALPLVFVVAAQLTVYGFTLLASVFNPEDHVRSSLYRVASALVPLAVLALAAAVAPRVSTAAAGGSDSMNGIMSDGIPTSPLDFLRTFASRLRYPQLFFLTAGLFVLDLIIPDLVPFADEILLGLLTLMLARFKDRRDASPEAEGEPEMKNVTPDRDRD